MTKRAQVEELHRQGKTSRDITALTGISYRYVWSIISNIKSPGILAAAAKRYSQTEKGRQSLRKSRRSWRKTNPESFRKSVRSWRKRNPERCARYRQSLVSTHQSITLPKANNHRERWTMAEIEYLKKYGQEETAHHIALKLGRSYHAVQNAGHRFGIDLRGNKMGKEANKFRGSYRGVADPNLQLAPV